MPSPRLRIKNRRGAFTLTVDQELAHGIRYEDYVWPLSEYLLPHPDWVPTRAAIETARAHEASMWGLYPGGPESIASEVRRG